MTSPLRASPGAPRTDPKRLTGADLVHHQQFWLACLMGWLYIDLALALNAAKTHMGRAEESKGTACDSGLYTASH